MFLKVFGVSAPFAFGALWYNGAFSGPIYSQDFDRPVPEVATALSDMDVLGMMGVGALYDDAPHIRTERTAEGYRWSVVKGSEVSLVMTAKLIPTNDGSGTHVEGRIEKGSLSNPESVAPVYRSPGAMSPLFLAALDAELTEISSHGDPAAIAEARKRQQLAQGYAAAAQIIADPNVIKNKMVKVSEMMKENAPPSVTTRGAGGASFEAGKPMVDVSR